MKEKEYLTEEEFLKNYDPNEFERLSVTSDIIIFSVSDGIQENYRKLPAKHFSILLVKRDNFPHKDKWCLPGGFVNIDETLEAAATRILANETNLHNIYMEQLYTFSSVNRDPRMRVISTSYMTLIDKNKTKDKLPDNACWFNIKVIDKDNEMKVDLISDKETISFRAKKKLINPTTNRCEYIIEDNNLLAFDHALIICEGLSRIKNKIEYTDIVFNMMPELFTLGELQQVYEAILGKKLLDPAFRRVIANKVEKTNKTRTKVGHRPSALFRYKNFNRNK